MSNIIIYKMYSINSMYSFLRWGNKIKSFNNHELLHPRGVHDRTSIHFDNFFIRHIPFFNNVWYQKMKFV